MRDYIFKDVEVIQKRLVQLADDLGYVVLAVVTGRNHSEKLARLNINETELRGYLQPGRADDDDGDEQEFDPEDALEAAAGVASAVDLANAAFRWILQNAGANMNSSRRCKFKLSAWSPKGDRLVYSARFSCEDPEYEADEEDEPAGERQPPTLVPVSAVLPVRAPGPPAAPDKPVNNPVLMLEAIPEGRVWKALGGGYEHLLHLYERGFGNLATLQNEAVGALSAQNVQNQAVIGELADRIVTMRVGGAVADREAREEVEGARVREELGKQFISELGTFGRVVAAAKFGMAPELVELAEIVNASPELLEAMKSPEVRQMLRDERTRKELAEFLVIAARSTAPSSPPPVPDPPKDQSSAA